MDRKPGQMGDQHHEIKGEVQAMAYGSVIWTLNKEMERTFQTTQRIMR